MPLLGRRLTIDPNRRSIQWADEGHQPSAQAPFDLALLAVVYLLEAKETLPSGEWVTPESLPAGAFFFRGPHAIPTDKVARRFGHDRGALLRAASKLGGKPVAWGDAAVELQALPRVGFRVVLWLGDDEFPARATFLFDRLVNQHLPLDVLHSLMRYLAQALVQAANATQ